MKTPNKKVITTFFILVFCLVVPVEAKLYEAHLNENIHISDVVSITKAVEKENRHENNNPPLLEVVLAPIMTVLICIYFLYYLKILSNEISIWHPIKSPVIKYLLHPLMPRKFHCEVRDYNIFKEYFLTYRGCPTITESKNSIACFSI